MQTTKHTELTAQQISDDLWGGWRTQTLLAGIELDFFTHIAAGNRTAGEIARRARASKRGTERLLDALVGLGYLTKKGGKYGLMPVARKFLVRGKETYVGEMVGATRLRWNTWPQLPEVVRSGKSVRDAESKEQATLYFSKLVPALFPKNYVASLKAVAALGERARRKIRHILDVGAGSGAWSIAFAQALPQARVTVLDFPEVTQITREFTTRFGVAAQYDYIEGNLRETDFGAELYDLIILGHIIHAEGEKLGKRLVQKSCRALRQGGLLLIAEVIPNDSRTGPLHPLLFGLNMLLHTEEGNVFTMREYKSWLSAAGFRRIKTVEAPAHSPLILATK